MSVIQVRLPAIRGSIATVGCLALFMSIAPANSAASLEQAPNAVSLESGLSSDPDFYQWSGDIPTAGTLLREEEYLGSHPEDSIARKILYATTYSDGSPAMASAVVTYPKSSTRDGGQRTVLAWQHGTTGVAQPCAPSLTTEALSEEAIPGISEAIERGWVVVATDYPGQGTGGKFPYLIGDGEGRSTLDAVRAVGSLSEAQAGTDALLWGHSQGGHATLFADQIANKYAPEINVRGVAALSAAAAPLSLAQKVLDSENGALSAVIGSFVLVPYSDEYADVHLKDYVAPGMVPLVRTYASRCVADRSMALSALSATVVSEVSPILNTSISGSPLEFRLRENIASGEGSAPLFLGIGTDDEVVDVEIQRELADRAQASGRVVEVNEYSDGTHMSVVAPGSTMISDLYRWAGELGM